MRISRIDQLEQYILEHRSASIDDLCEAFEISKNTVRRDLEVLVSRGTVEKVYGGVVACDSGTSIPNLVAFNEMPAAMPRASRGSPPWPLPLCGSGISYTLTAAPPP
ncbi:MAG: DeoR family transcriptional regulator [Lacrimispora sp.]